MNAVMIIPTGIGCAIGGHAGDATPAAILLASVCDTLFLHPNVVNAADINEMPANSFYVEGSTLDRFLEGEICLQPVRQNRILLAVNPPVSGMVHNVVATARHSAGIDVEVLLLRKPLVMKASYDPNGRAIGTEAGGKELIEQVHSLDFDALALFTPIEVDTKVAETYFRLGGVNPWGGIEAIVSRKIATAINKPVAHAPFPNPKLDDLNFQCQPRAAAEFISWTALFCVLKGLHRAPRISTRGGRYLLNVHNDVDCLVTPTGCWGRPHLACVKQGIPIIVVRENSVCVRHPACSVRYIEHGVIHVRNYWETAGVLAAMKIGIDIHSVRI
jgi:hypothetical protein